MNSTTLIAQPTTDQPSPTARRLQFIQLVDVSATAACACGDACACGPSCACGDACDCGLNAVGVCGPDGSCA